MAYGSSLAAQDDPPAMRKKRGAFYTPPVLANFIAVWAIRSSHDCVLEPSCGEGAFILAAARRLDSLGLDSSKLPAHLHACELHDISARQASERLSAQGYSCAVETCDFLSKTAQPTFDAVIGNPPFQRFQTISADTRDCANAISRETGVPFNALTSLWVPFTVHATSFLASGGCLGLVLPAELLAVNYAAPVRSFLMSSFASIQLVTFEERVFPEVQEEVVLLLADGYHEGSAGCLQWRQCRNLEDLDTTAMSDYAPRSRAERWSPMLAPAEARRSLESLLAHDFCPLETWGTISLGAVTGRNSFFALTKTEVEQLGLSRESLIPLCPPGSQHLRRLSFEKTDWEHLKDADKRSWLFWPNRIDAQSLSQAERRYVEQGVSTKVSTAYKCRNRSPWWRVPLTNKADAFITYMNSFGPNICTNDADVYHLNSCHGIVFENRNRELGMGYLPLAALNSATAFSAEIVGRSYGGGLLKLEPRESAHLAVPSADTVAGACAELDSIRPRVVQDLERRDFEHASSLVDSVLLEGSLGMSREETDILAHAAAKLRARRMARGRKEKRP